MTTPAPDPLAVDEALLARFREVVRGLDVAKHPDAAMLDYLEGAKLDVDRRVGGATVPVRTVRDWYVQVAADRFDRDQAPGSNVPDRWGGDAAVRPQRSTRNPLAVIERQVRQWVPTW